jgi:hypothetical protein
MGVPEPSVVGSEGGFTDLSKRTDRTSYSIPDDGRAVTIQTERRRRRREADNGSTLSHGTNTSLLIEYFENGNGKAGSGSSGRNPSVRVKVTPSAARRHRVNQSADGTGVEISEVGSADKPGRRPTHTHRIQLSSPHTGEDRLTLGQAPRPRSYSGDHSTLSSMTSGGEDSNLEPPFNVTVVREAGSPRSILSTKDLDAERRRRRRTQSKSRADDSYFGADVKNSKKARSRSVSRESDIYDEPGLRGGGLGRRKSRSMSRDRTNRSNRTDKETIEQAIRDELARGQYPKAGKNRGLKPGSRSRSRSNDRTIDEIAAEKARARRKAAQIEGDDHSVLSGTGTDPALVELIRGTIRELLLPEIEVMKAKQQKAAGLQVPGSTLERGLSTKGPGRALSMPEVGKPLVVLSPDGDKSNGMGVVIAGGDKDTDKATEVISCPETGDNGLNRELIDFNRRTFLVRKRRASACRTRHCTRNRAKAYP